ncbi:MAG: hypothetical protein HYT37_01305 [Candidatus Sungbacteria bacterium]|nr:hypothetical protein [Candidatus Sungbacteria bacterium]
MAPTKNAIRYLLLILSIPLMLAGFLISGLGFTISSEFVAGRLQFFIWGVAGIFSGIVLWILVRSERLSYVVKAFLFGGVGVLVLVSIFMGQKCSDLKQELVLPQSLEGAEIIWNSPMVYVEDLSFVRSSSCVISKSVGREIWWSDASPRDKQLSDIPQNERFVIVNYFRNKPLIEGDGFIGAPSKTYLVVEDKNERKALVWVGFLKYASYYLDGKRFEDLKLGSGY